MEAAYAELTFMVLELELLANGGGSWEDAEYYAEAALSALLSQSPRHSS